MPRRDCNRHLLSFHHEDCDFLETPYQLDANIAHNELLSLGHPFAAKHYHGAISLHALVNDAIGDAGRICFESYQESQRHTRTREYVHSPVRTGL
jgi:uncharacterized protein (DUF2062 family)